MTCFVTINPCGPNKLHYSGRTTSGEHVQNVRIQGDCFVTSADRRTQIKSRSVVSYFRVITNDSGDQIRSAKVWNENKKKIKMYNTFYDKFQKDTFFFHSYFS